MCFQVDDLVQTFLCPNSDLKRAPEQLTNSARTTTSSSSLGGVGQVDPLDVTYVGKLHPRGKEAVAMDSSVPQSIPARAVSIALSTDSEFDHKDLEQQGNGSNADTESRPARETGAELDSGFNKGTGLGRETVLTSGLGRETVITAGLGRETVLTSGLALERSDPQPSERKFNVPSLIAAKLELKVQDIDMSTDPKTVKLTLQPDMLTDEHKNLENKEESLPTNCYKGNIFKQTQ